MNPCGNTPRMTGLSRDGKPTGAGTEREPGPRIGLPKLTSY